MCACRQKKASFLIEDILNDKKPYKNLSDGPKQALTCQERAKVNPINVSEAVPLITEAQREIDIESMNVNLQQRRNTFPLYPTPIKANIPWQYKAKGNYGLNSRNSFSFYSDPMLNAEQMLRNLSANRFASAPYSIRQYGFDRALPANCCNWWGVGGRRKGGQVRFSAAQTGALERRFAASKYLSPDERRALAASLRLSDRQVKTWFQNRRAKWRRTVPDSADSGSPAGTSEEISDDEVLITDRD